MRSELFSRFIPRKQEERAFFQTHEVFRSNEIMVKGYILGKELLPMVDAQIGSLKSGAARQTPLLVDTGAFATALMPEDGMHLLRRNAFVKRRSIPLVDGITRVESTLVNAEVWLNGKLRGKHSDQDILLAIKLPVYILDRPLYRGCPSLLGRDVLGHFERIGITLTEGEVIFEAGNSSKLRAYRKI